MNHTSWDTVYDFVSDPKTKAPRRVLDAVMKLAARGEASESRSAPTYAYSDQRPLPVDLSKCESRSVPPRCGFWGELERRCVRPDGHAGDHFLGEREPFDVGESRSVGASEAAIRDATVQLVELIERRRGIPFAITSAAQKVRAALDGVRAGEPTGRTDGKDLGDRVVGAVGLGESPTRPSSPVGVPLTVERLTELARIFNKETQEYTSEMSRHAVRDFAEWLASRLIPQPEENT